MLIHPLLGGTEGTGFVGLLALPLVFDPPLYILDFTIYTTFNREATLKTALELLDISSRFAILPRNQSPCVSNSPRGWSSDEIFDRSTIFLNPLVGTNSLYGKWTVRFFFSRLTCLRSLPAHKTLSPHFTDFEKKNDCFAVYFTPNHIF